MASETETGRDVLLQRRLRAYELALDSARRDAVQAAQTLSKLSARIAELELELSEAREQPARLEARLFEHQRALRAAEQSVYAERAYREELQHELATLERGREQADDTFDQLSAAAARRRELEEEVVHLRRRGDEAEHVAAASVTARQRAERRVAELTEELTSLRASSLGARIAAPLEAEFALVRRHAAPAGPLDVGSAALTVRVSARGLALERGLLARVSARQPAPAVVVLPAPAVAAPPPMPVRFGVVLRELRAELNVVGELVQHERAARRAAETRAEALAAQLKEHVERSSNTFEAIEQLRAKLGTLATRGPASALETSGPVEPERFAAALTRLRDATEAAIDEPPPAVPDAAEPEAVAPEPEPEAVAPEPEPAAVPAPVGAGQNRSAWLRPAFTRLAGQDPVGAGRLMLALLPFQRVVHPEPIAYDISLAGEPCLRITVTADDQTIETAAQTRPLDQVSFAVTGEVAELARLLTAGRLRRRFRRGLAKLHGDRRRLAALEALLSARLSLTELGGAGRLEPVLTLKLAAAMIDPRWTAGSAFTIGHRAPGPEGARTEVRLLIDDGRRVEVSASTEPPTTTIVCEPDALPAVLDGAEVPGWELDGTREPLIRLQRWIKRAQSA